MNVFYSALALLLLAGFMGPVIGDDAGLSVEQLKNKTLVLTIKYGLKSYLAASDFQKLKKETLENIRRKPQKEFEADYGKSWLVLKECPLIVAKYRLRPSMGQKEVLLIVARLTRADCQNAVDDIPDDVIAEQFNKFRNSPEMKNRPLPEQMDMMISSVFRGTGG